MSEYDDRQLKLMLSFIKNYQLGHSSLSSLICNLNALLNVLEDIDKKWIDLVTGYSGDLEEVYAVGLDQEKKEYSLRDREFINEAIQNILILIHAKLPPQKEEDIEN
ncbi:MAG: hypothetical protein H0X51_08880 [Parachlamydiaceae bacterium]|nr:hypothetical protein [Parachlamydiaceae bacterium]